MRNKPPTPKELGEKTRAEQLCKLAVHIMGWRVVPNPNVTVSSCYAELYPITGQRIHIWTDGTGEWNPFNSCDDVQELLLRSVELGWRYTLNNNYGTLREHVCLVERNGLRYSACAIAPNIAVAQAFLNSI